MMKIRDTKRYGSADSGFRRDGKAGANDQPKTGKEKGFQVTNSGQGFKKLAMETRWRVVNSAGN